MDDLSPRGTGKSPSAATGSRGASDQSGVAGIALAAVLTFALAQGSWQWFATYIGATLLVVVLTCYRPPRRTPDLRSSYVPNLVGHALVVGLCVAIALAPMLQRWAWLFPMTGTRDQCAALGTYESLRVEASLANLSHLADRDGAALAHARDMHRQDAVADCLASTTTLWLPVYGIGTALLVALGVWSYDRTRLRRESAAGTRRT